MFARNAAKSIRVRSRLFRAIQPVYDGTVYDHHGNVPVFVHPGDPDIVCTCLLCLADNGWWRHVFSMPNGTTDSTGKYLV